jgi:hypothetical protein
VLELTSATATLCSIMPEAAANVGSLETHKSPMADEDSDLAIFGSLSKTL